MQGAPSLVGLPRLLWCPLYPQRLYKRLPPCWLFRLPRLMWCPIYPKDFTEITSQWFPGSLFAPFCGSSEGTGVPFSVPDFPCSHFSGYNKTSLGFSVSIASIFFLRPSAPSSGFPVSFYGFQDFFVLSMVDFLIKVFSVPSIFSVWLLDVVYKFSLRFQESL